MSDDDYGMIGKALAGVGAALEKTSESVDRLFPGIRRFWLRRADSKDYLQSIEDIRTALEDAGIPDDVIGRMVLTYTVNAKHLDNLAQVLDLTAGMIGDESDDTPQFPAPDWCDTFSETASRSYDDKARGMWARLLAGEINQPGSFSKRTLHTLDEISPFEAKLFERLCSWSIGIRTPEGPWLPVPLIATNPTETAAGMISWHDASGGCRSRHPVIGPWNHRALRARRRRPHHGQRPGTHDHEPYGQSRRAQIRLFVHQNGKGTVKALRHRYGSGRFHRVAGITIEFLNHCTVAPARRVTGPDHRPRRRQYR